jgi:hypothetical protein
MKCKMERKMESKNKTQIMLSLGLSRLITEKPEKIEKKSFKPEFKEFLKMIPFLKLFAINHLYLDDFLRTYSSS